MINQKSHTKINSCEDEAKEKKNFQQKVASELSLYAN